MLRSVKRYFLVASALSFISMRVLYGREVGNMRGRGGYALEN